MYTFTLRFERITHVVFAELKLLEVQPVPENLTVVDLSWYEDFMNTSLSYLLCGKEGHVLVLRWVLTAFVLLKEQAGMCP